MKKIMVVEDDDKSLRIISQILEANHYQVITAKDGLEGLNKIKTFKPDYILLDIQSSDMDANQVALSLKKDDELNNIPVIILTTFAVPGDKKDAMDAKAEGFIEKPLNPEMFLSQFKSIVGEA